MNFENTEINQEDKKLLIMALLTYLGFIKREAEDNTDEEVTTFCASVMQLYEDNEEKLAEIFGDISTGVVAEFAMQQVKKLLQEF